MGYYFFYRPKPKRFNYVPRYYDPVKEAREQRKAELGLGSAEMSKEELFRAKMRSKWRTNDDADTKKSRAQRTLKAVIYVGIIAVVFYWVFCTDVFEVFVRGLGIGR